MQSRELQQPDHRRYRLRTIAKVFLGNELLKLPVGFVCHLPPPALLVHTTLASIDKSGLTADAIP